MAVDPTHRDRDEVEFAALAALAERADDGMSVLELRAAVDADIDRLEPALAELKAADLIEVESDGSDVTIYPADRAVVDPEELTDDEPGLVEVLRDRFGF